MVRDLRAGWLEDGRLEVMALGDVGAHGKISAWVPKNGDGRPWLAIVLVGMGVRWGRGGRCLVIVTCRERVLCLVVTVVGGKGTGG